MKSRAIGRGSEICILVAIYDRATLSRRCCHSNFRAGARAGVDPHAAERLARARAEEQFATQVAPCCWLATVSKCHDTALKKGGLDLSRREGAVAGGESGPVIVPGKSADSLLWDQLVSGDMPPQGNPLSDSDKAIIRDWIDAGAVWPIDMIDPAVYSNNAGASQTWVQRLTIDEYIETVRSTVGR